jgi:hypothetical protein
VRFVSYGWRGTLHLLRVRRGSGLHQHRSLVRIGTQRTSLHGCLRFRGAKGKGEA